MFRNQGKAQCWRKPGINQGHAGAVRAAARAKAWPELGAVLQEDRWKLGAESKKMYSPQVQKLAQMARAGKLHEASFVCETGQGCEPGTERGLEKRKTAKKPHHLFCTLGDQPRKLIAQLRQEVTTMLEDINTKALLAAAHVTTMQTPTLPSE